MVRRFPRWLRCGRHRAPRSDSVFRSLSTLRQGVCLAALSTALTSAGASLPLVDSDNSAPGPDSPQAQPRGNGRIELPELSDGVPPEGAELDGPADIPRTALEAYKSAEAAVAAAQPRCKLPWELVAGIGRVESVHATGYGLREDGTTEKAIRGPRLDGEQFALIRDTDEGRWDGDAEYDRAVGPMQFIPSTWKDWGADGNGDGERTPNNIYDAALGTGLYLCADDRDLSTAGDLDKAVLSYNQSREYVNAVLGWMRTYQGGVHAVSDPPTATATANGNGNGAGGTGQGNGTSGETAPQQPTPQPSPSAPAKPKPSTPHNPGKPPTISDPIQPSTPQASRLERVGDGRLDAEAGGAFDVRPRARAVDGDGRAVPGERVTFEIIGKTGARFAGGATRVSVATDHRGIATAPDLRAGDRPGSFTVRAALRALPAVVFEARVRPVPSPVPDTLTRTSDVPLHAPVGGTFSEPITVRVTAAGKPVAGAVLTATLPPGETGDDVGPYFTGEDGLPTGALVLAPSDADGKVTLPDIYAGDHPGTYSLTLSTAQGVTLPLVLTVTAPRP